MSDIKCIIIEDEPLSAKMLSGYIERVPFLKLQGIFKDAFKATEWLHLNTPDLIFLDIHLPKLKGITFLKTLPHPPAVIITTAYNDYAVEGFELNVTDYLLKPFQFERFLVAVNKVRSVQTQQDIQENKDWIFVSVNKNKVKIFHSDILYIESQLEYVKIVCMEKTYLSKTTTGEIEAVLPHHLFKRVHRSYIVSVKKIDSYNAEAVEIRGASIPIGRSYKTVLERL